jgi:hypothetical protein
MGAKRRTSFVASIVIAVTALGTAGSSAVAGADQPQGKRYCPTTGEDRLDTRVLDGRAHFKARLITERHDCVLRVVKRGDTWLDITMDLVSNRVNVAIRDGRVASVYGTF